MGLVGVKGSTRRVAEIMLAFTHTGVGVTYSGMIFVWALKLFL